MAWGLICFVTSVLHGETKLECSPNQPQNITKHRLSQHFKVCTLWRSYWTMAKNLWTSTRRCLIIRPNLLFGNCVYFLLKFSACKSYLIFIVSSSQTPIPWELSLSNLYINCNLNKIFKNFVRPLTVPFFKFYIVTDAVLTSFFFFFV